LFLLVLVLQLGAASLFWRASLETKPLSPQAQPKTLHPFVVAIAQFAGFVVFDELLVIYRRLPILETTHLVALCALLLSLLLIRTVSEERRAA
jgi:hypothetical protein